MSLQIPHRDKANGASAATKAVILVGFCNENVLKGAMLTGETGWWALKRNSIQAIVPGSAKGERLP
jgi:hypothetical protein